MNGMVRACEVWYKVNDLEMDRQRTRSLERRVKELEAELKKRQSVRLAR